jgi:hypothetical protein
MNTQTPITDALTLWQLQSRTVKSKAPHMLSILQRDARDRADLIAALAAAESLLAGIKTAGNAPSWDYALELALVNARATLARVQS